MIDETDALGLQGGGALAGDGVPADLLAPGPVQGLDPQSFMEQVAAAAVGFAGGANAIETAPQEASAPLFRPLEPGSIETRAPAERDTTAPTPESGHHFPWELERDAGTEDMLHPLAFREIAGFDAVGAQAPLESVGAPVTFTVASGARAAATGATSALDPEPVHAGTSGISGNVSFGTTKGTGWESAYIDTLISGVKLDATGPIHYYLATTADNAKFNVDYNGNYKLYDWTSDEQTAVADMFQLYENVTSLQFEQVTDYADADIVWWQSNASFFTQLFGTSGYIGFNEFPDASAGTILPLYGAFDHNYVSDNMFQGADGFLTLMHELGHGLGLAHPHDGYSNGVETFPGVTSSASEGTYQLNQQIWTEMSYNRGWDDAPWTMTYGGAGTPMTLDIAALQDIYGANATFANGDDSYDLPTANAKGTFWTAIWDTDGTDTIDGSASKSTVLIDLREAPLDGPDAGGYVSWQKGIAGGFIIANDVTIENALGGNGADTITGNDADNKLVGNGGNDSLDGRGGADDLQGGLGNDTYWLDDAGDKVTEAAGAGTDAIKSSLSIDLDTDFNGEEIENVTLLTGATDATGNALNNALTGNESGNRLDGAAGDDTLTGGKGNDVYLVDSADDKVVETVSKASGGGTDEVDSAVTFSLASLGNIDNLVLTGTGDIDGTGNGLINHLIGNAKDNVLDGGGGIDVFDGGAGDDTYVLDSAFEAAMIADSSGSDTVRSSAAVGLIADIENYVNTGAAAWILDLSARGNEDNRISGGSGIDKLTGGDGDDVLDGGKGADTLNGGLGNDTYVVDNAKDQIADSGGADDTVESSIAIKAAIAGIESYAYTGKSAWTFTADAGDNTLSGGSAADKLNGGAGKDTLIGNGGNDTLDGGGDADNLAGGLGNDTYFVDNAGDTITEVVKAGTDTLVSVLDVDLATGPFKDQEIENITLLAGAVNAVGNALNNVILGNDAANTLDGGGGNDTLTGGKGDDLYIVDTAADKIVETLTFAKSGGTDTVESVVTFSLAKLVNIDDLTLTGTDDIGGTGNALVNHMTGNAGNNLLDGGKGIDVFDGGAGNDTYVLDNLAETSKITDSAGSDTIKSALLIAAPVTDIENYTYTGTKAWVFDISADGSDHHLIGSSGADKLTSGDGDDTLEGGKGSDTLAGGKGDDSLTGGLGMDTFKYAALSDRGTGDETITDFKTGKGGDVLDIHDLLSGLGTDAAHAVGDGFLQFAASGGDTLVQIDANGGGDGFVTLVKVTGVALDPADTANLHL